MIHNIKMEMNFNVKNVKRKDISSMEHIDAHNVIMTCMKNVHKLLIISRTKCVMM